MVQVDSGGRRLRAKGALSRTTLVPLIQKRRYPTEQEWSGHKQWGRWLYHVTSNGDRDDPRADPRADPAETQNSKSRTPTLRVCRLYSSARTTV